jgi:hypothetical protein
MTEHIISSTTPPVRRPQYTEAHTYSNTTPDPLMNKRVTKSGTTTGSTPGSVSNNASTKTPHYGTPDDDQWLAAISRIGGVRGEAVVGLSRFLRRRRHSSTALAAVALAEDLTATLNVAACENLLVLLNDGWDQSLAQLLDCARTL